jgi:hypothetical protein
MIFYLVLLFLLVAGGYIYNNPVSLLKSITPTSELPISKIGYWVVVLVIAAATTLRLNRFKLARKLDQEGITTQAEIVERRISEGVDFNSFFITYAYLTNQQANAEVPSKIYYSAREGDRVLVIYLPHQPEISRLDISSVPVRPKSLSYSRPSPFWDDRDKRM